MTTNWPARIAILMLFILSIIQSFRINNLDHRISYLTDELIKTKQDALTVDQSVAEFMKHTNESIAYTRQALDYHSTAILHLASGGAR